MPWKVVENVQIGLRAICKAAAGFANRRLDVRSSFWLFSTCAHVTLVDLLHSSTVFSDVLGPLLFSLCPHPGVMQKCDCTSNPGQGP